MAYCPAHNDSNPSLSVANGSDGRILVHCHAGCPQDAVIQALKARELWPAQQTNARGIIVATYDYTNETGSLLYQVVRYEPKGFCQRYPDGKGGWVWKKYAHQVLYHMPEVLESPIVFVVEGEKDVETLRTHGFCATTNAGGANAAWLPQFTCTLRDRHVYLIPDNDRAGWTRAKTVAEALLGEASRLVILELDQEVKDITDWFGAGHSEVELIRNCEVNGGRI